MNNKSRGITCVLSDDKIYSFLNFIIQGDYDCYAPWCLKNEETKLLPQSLQGMDITDLKLQEIEEQGLWELVLHIYPKGTCRTTINTYNDFEASDCICCLIYYDCGMLDIYIKDTKLIDRIWERLRLLEAENMIIITKENDFRTRMCL